MYLTIVEIKATVKQLQIQEDLTMRLKDTGLTAQDIKDKVSKYMIETYERFDFLAETAEGMYLYDENGTPYLDFYAGNRSKQCGKQKPEGCSSSQRPGGRYNAHI